MPQSAIVEVVRLRCLYGGIVMVEDFLIARGGEERELGVEDGAGPRPEVADYILKQRMHSPSLIPAQSLLLAG